MIGQTEAKECKTVEYKKIGDTYVVRIDLNEEVIQSLTRLCEQENIILAQVDGLGAVNQAAIGVYDLQEQAYHREELEGFMEITGLTGSVTRMNGQPYLHLHVTLADQQHMVHGGHVLALRIGATCELFVRTLSGEVTRQRDQEIGINLMQLESRSDGK